MTKRIGRPKAPTEPRSAPVSVRMRESVRKALAEAAASERRTVSALAEIFIEEKLREHGWLK